MSLTQLLSKYDQRLPRYTSYPPVPYWQGGIQWEQWVQNLRNHYQSDQGLDLYLHIPFCQSLCWYCGCHRTITKDKSRGTQYVELLLKQWNLYQKVFGPQQIKVNSIHLGGGTPTFLSAQDLKMLLEPMLQNKNEKFIGSIEIDPRTVDFEQLNFLSLFGFGRISMGIQDFDPYVQQLIHRHQPVEMVQNLMNRIRELKFESVNFDLIYGLPGQSLHSLGHTIEKVKELKPDMIAFYSYAHLPEKLKNQKLIDESTLPNAQLKSQLYQQGKEWLMAAGYQEIGMDHFALPENYLAQAQQKGKLMRNFMGYTDSKSNILLGLGVSSISRTTDMMFQNTKELKELDRQVNEGHVLAANGHRLDQQDLQSEFKVMQVMCQDEFEVLNLTEELLNSLSNMQQDGLLQIQNGVAKLSPLGRGLRRNIAALFDHRLQQRRLENTFSQSV